MVPVILFIGVSAVAVLSLAAMVVVARKQFIMWRAHRAHLAARSERLSEALRMKTERQDAARLAVAPMAPTYGESVIGLTSIISKLEESTRFARLPASPPPLPPRARVAKGSVPIPMANQTARIGAIRSAAPVAIAGLPATGTPRRSGR